jgi:hypothetical protein
VGLVVWPDFRLVGEGLLAIIGELASDVTTGDSSDVAKQRCRSRDRASTPGNVRLRSAFLRGARVVPRQALGANGSAGTGQDVSCRD